MSRSTTAVLLSALVLPGAGHLYLKYFWRGIALLATSLVCLSFIIDRAMQQASAVIDNLGIGAAALDPVRITDLVSQTSNNSGSSVATLVLSGCWLAGIVDTYRLGRKKTRED